MVQCWTCRRTQGDIEHEGMYDSEFEEFEFEGKTIYLCGVCTSLIEEVSLSLLQDYDDEEEDEDDDEDEEDEFKGNAVF